MSTEFESTNATMPKSSWLHQLALAAISKLNLVTRQEFATQTQVLIKTRLRVEELEKKLLELQEHKLAQES